ncbi:hypothetical protein FA13DRAFT_1805424 [Coprinellus micaceus]|uniref:Uncharacterized protein n=1 Tax=Coprinellus micaceus TaxID=71717 RepID=A0A4Y7S058_COPMI|nr:hypothetical protein FA13DRAFT_1805424 [Coprinellus micaceus]
MAPQEPRPTKYPRKKCPLNDADVVAVSQHMDQAAGLFTSVKCALIGVNCSQTHIVSVLVRPGSQGRPRNVDLITSRYLRDGGAECVCVQPHENVWCIGPFRDTVTDREQLECEPFFLTIFVNPQLPSRKAGPSSLNFLFERLQDGPDEEKRQVAGNILLIKTGRDRVACDVLAHEIPLFEYISRSFLVKEVDRGKHVCG